MKKANLFLIPAAVAGQLLASNASAWTTVNNAQLEVNNPVPVEMSVRPASFSDQKFGYQGWAMHGKWGVFEAQKGKSYKIIVDGATNPGLHPAVAVYYRPTGADLTPANRVPDHNFMPVQSYINSGRTQRHVMESGGGNCTTTPDNTWTRTINGSEVTATPCDFWKASLLTTVNETTPILLEDGATEIGFARLLLQKAAVDVDKAATLKGSLNVSPALIQQKDGKAGKVSVKFKAPESGQYQIFVGGMNPDPGVDTAVAVPVQVKVKKM